MNQPKLVNQGISNSRYLCIGNSVLNLAIRQGQYGVVVVKQIIRS